MLQGAVNLRTACTHAVRLSATSFATQQSLAPSSMRVPKPEGADNLRTAPTGLQIILQGCGNLTFRLIQRSVMSYLATASETMAGRATTLQRPLGQSVHDQGGGHPGLHALPHGEWFSVISSLPFWGPSRRLGLR